ncbi:MAG: MurR/RpiR family transcriptional regulator, partial [Deltaproteobacteria bacterium]|nr:MurR/RpiR family transcriptional regulator [Deltaproteobacteria bacterium]
INSAFIHLGKAEKRVATFVKNYPEEVIKLPINVLAEKVGVSVSTIIRLCRRIGINGYTDLKIDITRDLALNYKKTYSEINSNDSIPLLLNKVQQLFSHTISNTFKILSISALKEAYLNIINSDSVLIIGAGGTAALAKLLNHKLLKLEINSQWSDDFSLIPLLINRIGKNDVLFVLSHSGSTNLVYDAVVMAKKKGCKIIILTNYLQSPMAKKSDIILATGIDEQPLGSEGVTTRMAQISIIEVLCLLIELKKQEIL